MSGFAEHVTGAMEIINGGFGNIDYQLRQANNEGKKFHNLLKLSTCSATMLSKN